MMNAMMAVRTMGCLASYIFNMLLLMLDPNVRYTNADTEMQMIIKMIEQMMIDAEKSLTG